MRDKPIDEGTSEIFRRDPAFAIALLNDILADGDQEELLIVLRQIAATVDGAEKAQLNQLYQTLSIDGNPSLSNLVAILKAVGLQLIVRPAA